MYKIFKDKDKMFKCRIDVQGADIEKCKARLIIESNNGLIIMHNGKITESGNCEVVLPKNYVFDEGDTGKVMLEVVADNTLFTPWEETFEVMFSKKVEISMDSDEEETGEPITELNSTSVKVTIDNDDNDNEDKDGNSKMLNNNKHRDLGKVTKESKKIKSKKIKSKKYNNIPKNNGDDFLDFDNFLKNK